MTDSTATIMLGVALFVVGLVTMGSSRASDKDAARLHWTGGAISISGLLVIVLGVLWGETLPHVAFRWVVLVLMAFLLSRLRGPG